MIEQSYHCPWAASLRRAPASFLRSLTGRLLSATLQPKKVQLPHSFKLRTCVEPYPRESTSTKSVNNNDSSIVLVYTPVLTLLLSSFLLLICSTMISCALYLNVRPSQQILP